MSKLIYTTYTCPWHDFEHSRTDCRKFLQWDLDNYMSRAMEERIGKDQAAKKAAKLREALAGVTEQ